MRVQSLLLCAFFVFSGLTGDLWYICEKQCHIVPFKGGPLLDTFKHKGQRARLVKKLEERGITDERVLEAIGVVPRHLFVEGGLIDEAYEDKALPIQGGQTISQPFTVAFQTQLLEVKPRMKVLEIGTGSGYQAAVLCAMGVRLFTVELDSRLHREAKRRLHDLGYEAKMLCGDGSQGWAQFQPYERILVTAASPEIPEALKRQLDIGGRMVIPVGSQAVQEMLQVVKISSHEFEVHRYHQFKFVPLRGRFGFETEDNQG